MVKKLFKNINIFNFEIIFIPINYNNNHWILVTIENFKCKVTLYDSFNVKQEQILNNLKQYLDLKYQELFVIPLTYHWSFDQDLNIPLQKNTYDCVIFLCKIAHLKSLRIEIFNFLARDMEFYRKNVLFSILLNKII